jgi:hypothetical protein
MYSAPEGVTANLLKTGPESAASESIGRVVYAPEEIKEIADGLRDKAGISA